jgi:hypothetical protein
VFYIVYRIKTFNSRIIIIGWFDKEFVTVTILDAILAEICIA